MEKNINNEIRHYSIKCTVGDQIRRFRIEGTNKQELYEALCEEVKTNDSVQIYWTDDEDDQCVLNSAADLDEAVQQAQNNIVRMYVKEIKSTQGAAAPVTITPVQTDAVSGINPMGQRPLDAHHRDVGAVHNATCDLCDCCIIGHRFICLECDDYDLCASCESTSAHYEHVMMRIVDPNTTKIPWGTKVFQNVHRIHRSLEKKTADEKLKDLAKNSVQAISEVGSFIAAALNDFGIETTYEVRNGGQRCGTRKETSAPATPVTPAAPVSVTVPVVSQETPVLVEVKVEEKKEAPAVQKAEKKELTQEDKTTVATVMENLLNDVQKKGREFRAAVEQKKQEGVKEKQARKAEVIKILDEKKKAAKQTTEESPFAQVKSDGPPGFATREKPFRYRDDESDLGANSFGSGNGSARRFGRPTARGGFGAASGISSSRGYSRGFVNEPRNTFERPGFSQSGFQNKEEAFGYQSNFGDNRNSFGGCDFGGGSRFGSGRGFESSRGGFGNDGFANGGGSNKNSFEQPGFGQSGFSNREEGKQQTGIGGNSSFGGSGFGSGQEFEISPQAVFGANSDSFGNSRGGFGSKPTGFGSVASECGFGSGSFENKSSGFGGFENKQGAFGSGSRFGKPRHPYSERTRADFGTRPRYSFEYGPEFEDSDDDGWGLGSGHSDHHGFGAPSFESPKKSSFGGDSSFSFGAVKGEKSTSVFEQPRSVKYSADDKKAPEEFAPPPPTQLKKEKTPEEEKIDEIKKEEIKKNASRTNKEFYKMVQQKVKQDVAPEAQEAEDDKLVVIDPDQESIGSDIVTFPEDCDSDGWVDAAEKAASERVKEVSAAPAYPKLDETVVELMPETNQANNIEVDKTLAALISFGYSDTQARRAISHCGCDIENCLDYITLQE